MPEKEQKQVVKDELAPAEADQSSLSDEQLLEMVFKKPLAGTAKKIAVSWCVYFCSVALLVLMMPNEWFNIPAINAIVMAIVNNAPQVAYLAKISDDPIAIMNGYGLVWLSAPIHAVIYASVAIIRYRAGEIPRELIKRNATYSIFLLIGIWLMLIVCLNCKDEPGWADRLLASGPLFIAIFGQGFIALAMAAPGALITALLQWLDGRKKPVSEVSDAR